MGATERIVRHLRLRADSEASVRRTALKLEDALRCASLPDTGAHVLLVRRLDLGPVAAGASPQSLSLLLEQRVAAVGGTWVHGSDASAEGADFVSFRDGLEARTELASRIARSAPRTSWYWPLAVPEFKPAEGAQANLRRIALAIAALPEAPAALPAWVARLTAAGAAPALARAIGPVEAAALLRAARLSANASHPRLTRIALPRQPPLPSGAREAEGAETPPHRKDDPAFAALPAWVQSLALAGGFVPRVTSAVRNVRSTAAPRRSRDADAPVPAEADLSAIMGSAGRASHAADDIRTEAAPGPPPSALPYLDAAPSACGGLLFLLPVLQRLGFTAWAEVLAEGLPTRIVQEVFSLVLRRLDAPSNDPAWLLAGASGDDDFRNIDVEAPAGWNDPALVAPRGSAAGDIIGRGTQARSAAAHAVAWLIASRRWLRRAAGIGVASLVMRPAALGLTDTHADVYFRLSDADMRVRRAGLDLDPGWLPWYGRVVMFHYEVAP